MKTLSHATIRSWRNLTGSIKAGKINVLIIEEKKMRVASAIVT